MDGIRICIYSFWKYRRGVTLDTCAFSWNCGFSRGCSLGFGTLLSGSGGNRHGWRVSKDIWKHYTMEHYSKREKPEEKTRMGRKPRRDGCSCCWWVIDSFLAGLSIVPGGQWMSEVVLCPSSQALGQVAGPSMRASVRRRLLGWKRQSGTRLAEEVPGPWR